MQSHHHQVHVHKQIVNAHLFRRAVNVHFHNVGYWAITK